MTLDNVFEELENISNSMDKLNRQAILSTNKIKEAEDAIKDCYHYLEFSKLNAVQTSKVTKHLKGCLEERRLHLDIRSAINTASDSIEDKIFEKIKKGSTNREFLISSQIKKQVETIRKSMEKRSYRSRVVSLADILKN